MKQTRFEKSMETYIEQQISIANNILQGYVYERGDVASSETINVLYEIRRTLITIGEIAWLARFDEYIETEKVTATLQEIDKQINLLEMLKSKHNGDKADE